MGHLDESTGIVGDGPERVHRQDVGRRAQHSHRGYRRPEQPRMGQPARGAQLVGRDDAAEMVNVGSAVHSRATANPAMMFVAGPVTEAGGDRS